MASNNPFANLLPNQQQNDALVGPGLGGTPPVSSGIPGSGAPAPGALGGAAQPTFPDSAAPFPAQGGGDEARVTVDNPSDPETKNKVKSEWKNWFKNLQNDENAQLALMKAGFAMMQPMEPGQSAVGHIARSLSMGMDELAKLKQQAQESELRGARQEQIEASTEATRKDTEQADEKLDMSQRRVAAYESQVGLQKEQWKKANDPDRELTREEQVNLRQAELRNELLAKKLEQIGGERDFTTMSTAEQDAMAMGAKINELQKEEGLSLPEAKKQAEEFFSGKDNSFVRKWALDHAKATEASEQEKSGDALSDFEGEPRSRFQVLRDEAERNPAIAEALKQDEELWQAIQNAPASGEGGGGGGIPSGGVEVSKDALVKRGVSEEELNNIDENGITREDANGNTVQIFKVGPGRYRVEKVTERGR